MYISLTSMCVKTKKEKQKCKENDKKEKKEVCENTVPFVHISPGQTFMLLLIIHISVLKVQHLLRVSPQLISPQDLDSINYHRSTLGRFSWIGNHIFPQPALEKRTSWRFAGLQEQGKGLRFISREVNIPVRTTGMNLLF